VSQAQMMRTAAVAPSSMFNNPAPSSAIICHCSSSSQIHRQRYTVVARPQMRRTTAVAQPHCHRRAADIIRSTAVS